MRQAITLTVFIVLLVAIGPLLTIWSLNTLFPQLNIPYSFETWRSEEHTSELQSH